MAQNVSHTRSSHWITVLEQHFPKWKKGIFLSPMLFAHRALHGAHIKLFILQNAQLKIAELTIHSSLPQPKLHNLWCAAHCAHTLHCAVDNVQSNCFFHQQVFRLLWALVVFCIKLPDGGGDTKLSALSLFHFHHVHCHQRYNCCHRQCLLVIQKKHIHAKLLNTTIALKIRKWQNDKHVSQPRRNTRIFNRTLDTSLFNQTQHHCVSYQSNISPFCQKYFCDCQDDDEDDDGDDHGVIDDGVDRDGGGPPLVGVNWK